MLVTVKPTMYRETLALALHRYRPDAEVMLVSSDFLDGEVAGFSPHLLVHNDNEGATPEALNNVLCRIEVLIGDSISARIIVNGRVREIEDMCMDDLLRVVDEVEALISEGKDG
jgi:hypothetical protein